MKKDDTTGDLPGWEGMPPAHAEVQAQAEAVRLEPFKKGERVRHLRATGDENYEVAEVEERQIALRNLRTQRVHHIGMVHARRYLRRMEAACTDADGPKGA